MELDVDELSLAIIKSWILSEDAPSGDLWDSLCAQLGLDPDLLSTMVLNERKRYPRLKCGHFDIDSNVYQQFNKRQCRTCKGSRPPDTRGTGDLDAE